jgi:hypothetical protein
MKKFKDWYFNLFLFIVVTIISLLSSFRDFSVGANTLNYVNHFYGIMNNAIDYKFEIGFNYFSYFIGLIYKEARFFLFVITFFITSVYLYFLLKILKFSAVSFQLYINYIILFFTFILFSNWYLVAIANGIRQGLSLSVLYLSLYYLIFKKKYFVFIFLYILSVSFHRSSILLLPFLIFFTFRFKTVFFIWFIIALFYPLGLNELIVKHVSYLINYNLYDAIKYYSIDKGGVGTGRFEGFDIRFFLFTIFWPFLLIFLLKIRYRVLNACDLNTIKKILVIYFLLTLPYFVCGFGPFSNRYAQIGWFFVPVMQVFIFYALKIKFSFLYYILVCTAFSLSFLYFFLIQLDFKSWYL